MFRRFLSLLLCVMLMIPVLPANAFAADTNAFMETIDQITDFSDIPEGYNCIMDQDDLEAIENDPDGYYILMEDIELENFDILCSSTTPFTGVLEGNGHTISGIMIDSTASKGSTYYWGLFSTIDGARIADLKISGSMTMTTTDSQSSNSGFCYLGGLAGKAIGDITISNCVSDVTINYSSERVCKYIAVGGLIGYYNGTSDSAKITSCKNVADITAPRYTGGLVGQIGIYGTSLDIVNCRNTGDITGHRETYFDGNYTGGLFGHFAATGSSNVSIYACMNTGSVENIFYAAGLAGYIDNDSSAVITFNSCANTGNIVTREYGGGLIASTYRPVSISDCINTGSLKVSASQTAGGGIVGYTKDSVITHCINTGEVSCGSYNSGIACEIYVTASNASIDDFIVECYFLDNNNTSCRIFASGSASYVTTGMMTVDEMKIEENFKGLSFPDTWTMDEELGHPFPTALLDITLDNTYQTTYINNTVSFADDSYRYVKIMGGSGDGSFAGILGDTYSDSLLDEVNGVWDAMQFTEGLANYTLNKPKDYDALLADLIAGSVSRNVRDEITTATTLNFASELITVSGAGLDAVKILATEKSLADLADDATIFSPATRETLDALQSSVLADLPYDDFAKGLQKLGGIVNIISAGAAGCETMEETYNYYVLCNTYADMVESYCDVIEDAAISAHVLDAKEGEDLYDAANELVTLMRKNMEGNPEALYNATGGTIGSLMTVTGFTSLETVLDFNNLNPILAGIKTGFSVGMPIADALTGMDKIAYYGRMMDMAGVFSKGLYDTVQYRADQFAHSRSYEDAQALNAAVNLYLNLQIQACDYAIGYCHAIYSNNMSQTFKLNQDDLAASIQILALKADLLDLQTNGKSISIGNDGSINGFIANCPVTVIVSDSSGNEITRMKTGSISTAEEYQGNYQLLGDSGEHKAGFYKPDGQTLTIIGEENGTMDLVIYESENGQLTEIHTYEDVPVTEGEEYVVKDGYLDGKTDVEPTTTETIFINPFVDVKESDWFYDAVLWAAENNITKGTNDTHFSPSMVCDRAQVVTFLYRANGSPKVSGENPFTDVKETDYYYNAVLWAVEKGITQGTGGTTFSPRMKCDRSQIVTFLYRANGSPAVGMTENPFVDVNANAYYYTPVLWAVENEITVGTNATHFSPLMQCDRGQIVTFLYRAQN